MPDNDIIGISLFIKKWDMTGLYEGGYYCYKLPITGEKRWR